MAKLSPRELSVLECYHLNYDLPLREASRILGLKDHTVRRILQKLDREGLIVPHTVVDTYRLGYLEYILLASLNTRGSKKRETILEYLNLSQYVSWYMEIAGDFEVGMALRSTTSRDLSVFLELLSKKFGNVFSKKSVSLCVSWSVFQRQFGRSESHKRNFLSCGENLIPCEH